MQIEERASTVAVNRAVPSGDLRTEVMERMAEGNIAYVPSTVHVAVALLLLCPLATRLAPRSTVCHVFSSEHE